jgi:hypothetical protein
MRHLGESIFRQGPRQIRQIGLSIRNNRMGAERECTFSVRVERSQERCIEYLKQIISFRILEENPFSQFGEQRKVSLSPMQQLLFEVRFRPEADMGQPGLFSSHSPAQKIVPMDASFYVVGLATLTLRSRVISPRPLESAATKEL